MTRQKRTNPRRIIDVKNMREEAAKLLGWQQVDMREASDMVGISERAWAKWENNKDYIPDPIVKVFWYEVGLTHLETLEHQGQEHLEKELGGPVTVDRVFNYIHALWEKWDPLGDRRRSRDD